ncbi:MAG: hypothetical protein COU35_02690 [Candidatus Magasanikbacteria bacterium CG10_big_fil_rev_8_21_14_0_10_47_10]|uniref:Response regulatory domain-containing protein n=1 Tax=Candidatus Magasanikbacteria bacterium CG10_big_fil_rev_8_21_14_0_10_47_10 TaxID=1974652 RepID=A0A2H0TQC8_9BACT|nr:MAG: hypothetical protein COU35_02690 [Candidatus Magasanikbacteria bacterium CG10_big_fil_rev_8_21_14_0_10_47_10]
MASLLIFEDNEGFRLLLCTLLTRLGHRVTVRESHVGVADIGPDCDRFTLIITDLEMPYRDGIAIVRQLHLQGARIPTVIMTGSTGARGHELQQLLDDGLVTRVIRKPTQVRDLVTEVVALLDALP